MELNDSTEKSESLSMWICSWCIGDAVLQDERYAKFIGKQAIVPLTFGRHVPILSDKVGKILLL